MAQHSLEKINKCLINTGNILSLNDITRKSGQNPADELFEAINITLNEYRNESNTTTLQNPKTVQLQNTDHVLIHRQNDDVLTKIAEQSLQDLKIGLKIFLNDDSKICVQEALNEALSTLKIPSVHSVIIAYNKQIVDDNFDNLKTIWLTLEEYVKDEKINQIGIADVDEQIFRKIYEWATIKPSIIQINLATCCVVPPTLQQFCKDMDIQLLTHGDPIEMLTTAKIQKSLNLSLSVKWILRFLVHIKCRGVLITKGYLISLTDDQ